MNTNIAAMKPSRSMVMMAKAKAMKAKDPTIVDLAGGEPDFATPDKITMEAVRQLSAGFTHYTVGTIPELKAAIAEKLSRENGCKYAPEGILVTPGAKYAIYLAVRALVNAGDEVIYLNPAWVSYASIIEASGAVPVAVDLHYENGYRITEALLEEKVTEKTKVILLNYPNNPTGRILHRDEFEVLRAFLKNHPDVYAVSDEIYERIRYDGKESVSLASDPELLPRVITVNGFSKSVAMTGWRIGYLAAEPSVTAIINKLFQHTITTVSGFIQKAALKAFECEPEIEQMRCRYEQRRDRFVGGLNQIPGVHCELPEGAFYAWVRFDMPGMDGEAVSNFILEKAGVVGVPGEAYGEERGSFMRFSFATSDEALEQAVVRISHAMEEYRNGLVL